MMNTIINQENYILSKELNETFDLYSEFAFKDEDGCTYELYLMDHLENPCYRHGFYFTDLHSIGLFTRKPIEIETAADYSELEAEIMDAARQALTHIEDEETRVYEKCLKIGLPEDAARFVSVWYPECESAINDIIAYGPYSWTRIAVYSEDELITEVLDNGKITEEYYENNRGSIFRDTAFSGVLVIGE